MKASKKHFRRLLQVKLSNRDYYPRLQCGSLWEVELDEWKQYSDQTDIDCYLWKYEQNGWTYEKVNTGNLKVKEWIGTTKLTGIKSIRYRETHAGLGDLVPPPVSKAKERFGFKMSYYIPSARKGYFSLPVFQKAACPVRGAKMLDKLKMFSPNRKSTKCKINAKKYAC